MGRDLANKRYFEGKKKGDKKPVTEELGELSLSEESAGPAAAAAPPPAEPAPPPKEEDEGGLGLGPSKSRKKKKPAAKPVQTDTAQTAAPVPTPGQPQASIGRGQSPFARGNVREQLPGQQQTVGQPGQKQPPQMGPPQQQYPQMGPPQQQYPHMAPPQQYPHTGPQQQYPHMGPPQQHPQMRPPWQQMGQPQQQMGQPPQQRAPWGQTPQQGQQQSVVPPPQGPTPQSRGPTPQKSPTPSATPPGPSPATSCPPSDQPQARPAAKSQSPDPMKCRFVIPARIDGRSNYSRPVEVLVNYLKMNIKAMSIHRYDVSFNPDKPKKAFAAAYKIALETHFPKNLWDKIAFDQSKNCYSVLPLPNVTAYERFVTNVEVQDDNGRYMKFEVSFKKTGVVDLGTIMSYMKDGGSSLNPPNEAIQCIDVVLRQGTLNSYVKAGRQFFKRPSNPILLGECVEMWTGLFQSAIFTSRPFINIDVAHKGFPMQMSLLDVINEFGLDPRKDLNKQKNVMYRGKNKYEAFTQFIKGLRVTARVGGDWSQNAVIREYICNGIVGVAHELRFTMTEASGKPREITVADYFAKEKGYRLQYPELNCMWVGPRDKKIYFPMELLEVSYGQVRNRQLTDDQVRVMIREAATPPDQRKAKIMEVIRDMNYKSNQYFKNFGLEISDQFTPVTGKILNVPKLKCAGNTFVAPSRGVWNSKGFLEGSALSRWRVVVLAPIKRSQFPSESLESQVKKFGQEMGMRVDNPLPALYDVSITNVQACMQAAVRDKLQMMIVIVSHFVPHAYSQVKKIAELQVGVLTQCLKVETVTSKLNAQTVKNILLKVNSKLMGVSHSIDASTLPACMRAGAFMAVGADVTHPSPEQTNIPSIAAVTASYEQKCFKYNIELSVQTPKKEIIVQFEDMMVDHLRVFVAHNRLLPKHIFVFRDGVSEGQFAEVLNNELQAIYNAYATVSGDKNKKPLVLFLLVQKRHHTRFFLDRSPKYNVEPGTCVDSDIVHPRELDFYMVSHQAIKGTARPTRYHVIANDANIPHDDVEQLTYYLCHMFSRCNRSVSYPTPTYYAHLACTRAKALTHGKVYDNQALERQPERIIINRAVQENSRMFFV